MEYPEALHNNDLIEIADGLGDMMYMLCRTIIEHGLQHKRKEVFDEIQRSNRSKLAEDEKPIYREDGQVRKGPNYFKPDCSKILGGSWQKTGSRRQEAESRRQEAGSRRQEAEGRKQRIKKQFKNEINHL